jgi:hypothetical protein
LVIVEARGATVPKVTSVVDSAGETLSKLVSTFEGGETDEEIWEVPNSIGGVKTVTATLSLSSAISMTVIEISGATPDGSATNGGKSLAPSTGIATTTQGNDLAIACVGWNSNPSVSAPTAGYTRLQTEQSSAPNLQMGEQCAYGMVASAGVASFTATLVAPKGAPASAYYWTGAIVAWA